MTADKEWYSEGARFTGLDSFAWETQWEVTVVCTESSSGFGRCKIVWDHDGFNGSKSTVRSESRPSGS